MGGSVSHSRGVRHSTLTRLYGGATQHTYTPIWGCEVTLDIFRIAGTAYARLAEYDATAKACPLPFDTGIPRSTRAMQIHLHR